MPHLRFLFEGPVACFSRPEFHVERVSYETMTPTAARGLLSSIFWKPEMCWDIDQMRIRSLKPIKFQTITCNEIPTVINPNTITKAVKSGDRLAIDASKYSEQRMTNRLIDVAFLVEASIKVLGGEHNLPSYLDQIKRRVKRGHCWQQPYFGLREMIASFRLLQDGEEPECEMSEFDRYRDLGVMLYDFKWNRGVPYPIFRRARLEDGYTVWSDCQ